MKKAKTTIAKELGKKLPHGLSWKTLLHYIDDGNKLSLIAAAGEFP